jgi:hypothetical protein
VQDFFAVFDGFRWDVAIVFFVAYMIGVGISRTIEAWLKERRERE